MSDCAICGTDLSKDLFASVTDDSVCCICKVKYIGGLSSRDRIPVVRASLGLKDGEYLAQDNAQEAARILGRRGR